MSSKLKYHAFVSYSRRDFDEVNQLLKKLKSYVPELSYWFDLDGIESGDEFVDKIVSAIDDSEQLFFMVSDNSINSKWTKQEVMYARNEGKRIIPILLKDARLKGWFLFTFGNIDAINTQDPRQLEKLIANLRQWCDSKTTTSLPIEEEKEPTVVEKKETLPAVPVEKVQVKEEPAKQTTTKEEEIPVPFLSDGKWGFKNKDGSIVIRNVYDYAEKFSDGRARVTKNGQRGFIDLAGNIAIPLIYDDVSNFSEGLAAVLKDKKWGFIDRSGNVSIPFVYDSTFSFKNGMAGVKKNGKWGVINKCGGVLLPFDYAGVLPTDTAGRVMLYYDGYWHEKRFF